MQFTNIILLTLALIATVVLGAPLESRASSGKGTYYYQNGNPGSCGKWHKDSDMIVAINSPQYKKSNCGRSLWITYNGKKINAVAADKCPSCAWGSLDLSVGAFKKLAKLDKGVINVKWGWN
ncbi:barwin-like endoglucanase [Violaceomyces palustris]|uniref:Barwin-like endoglucanase n=1 Tax=Violaceomyces palustris TaxID=1673888 RepID=A0ACD0P848_9BASI|nr:barwin-like endoglucanase [Violaceomyces palustris]